jgi:hypothetical protein
MRGRSVPFTTTVIPFTTVVNADEGGQRPRPRGAQCPPMDRAKFSAIAFSDHDVCSPIDGRRLDELIALLGLPPATVALHERAIEDFTDGLGTFDLVMNVGAIPEGGYRAMLRSMRAWARPGGLLLVGEGFWAREPAAAYLEAFGVPRDNYGTHADNVFGAIEEGLVARYAMTSNADAWDHFEGRYANAVERYVATHPDDPDAPAMKARITRWREIYLRWGRDTLGFGTYLFATCTRAARPCRLRAGGLTQGGPCRPSPSPSTRPRATSLASSCARARARRSSSHGASSRWCGWSRSPRPSRDGASAR